MKNGFLHFLMVKINSHFKIGNKQLDTTSSFNLILFSALCSLPALWGSHCSLWNPAQPEEFQFVQAPPQCTPIFSSWLPALWVSGSSTRNWSHSPRSTAHPATTPSGCASLVQHWTLHTAIVFFMTFLICYLLCSFLYSLLLKAYLISQEEFKSRPLHEAFPDIYCCCISLLALNASLRAEMMFHSYLYPQKQLSQCPMQNWSSINVCWLKSGSVCFIL